jgi:hypothetical protein
MLAISLAWSGAQVAQSLPPAAAAPCLAAGVFAGSAVWAPILALGVGRIAALAGGHAAAGLQRGCGAALCLCGIGLAVMPLLPRAG